MFCCVFTRQTQWDSDKTSTNTRAIGQKLASPRLNGSWSLERSSNGASRSFSSLIATHNSILAEEFQTLRKVRKCNAWELACGNYAGKQNFRLNALVEIFNLPGGAVSIIYWPHPHLHVAFHGGAQSLQSIPSKVNNLNLLP